MKVTSIHLLRVRSVQIISVSLACVLSTWLLFSVHATAATMGLSSSKSTVNKGETFSVVLSAKTQTPIASVYATIRYNPALVAYVSTDTKGSPIDNAAPNKPPEAGSVNIQRYTLPKEDQPFPSGEVFIARFSFKTINSGNVTFNIDESTAKLYSAVDFDGKTSLLSSVSPTSVSIGSSTYTGGSNSNPNGSTGDPNQSADPSQQNPDLPADGSDGTNKPGSSRGILEVWQQEDGGFNKPLIAFVVLLILLGGGLLWFVLKRRRNKKQNSTVIMPNRSV